VPRAVRKQRNRALFRRVNDSIADLERLHDGADSFGLLCECHRLGCSELVVMPRAVYATVREDDEVFLVRQGHEEPEQELVVADHGAFLIVRER
jgi:hypothetical protein